ncbi:homeodomain-interacting protein kinase 1-like [Epinephelus fuscoguttatus]|uniref:homeodomain-interacting protein kinase 1-like n=1 Tax=Epinephelus fuscoguttatus TaxID=293821 RepID=UPI0020D1850D|nr:homeodomain-interacting protein kinase 1-like [Epinephelus fuscoguttatus]
MTISQDTTSDKMSTSYRDIVQYATTSEEDTTSSSSSSDDESQVILGVLSSPSSDYLICSFLGQGVFGKVAKCTKSATKETVAVKIINNTYKFEALNEAAILKQLRAFDSDRYNFVRYYGAFTDKERFCLEFEMLDMSLCTFLEKRPRNCFSVKEIRPILHQMATTLQLLGSLGLVHTDLKPDNIMMVDHVNQPLKVKMIDFGLSRHASQMKSGEEMQALYYRSPEVILGHPCTAAIAMWSLGCTDAELFLGYALYPGSSEYDMLRHMVQTQGQLPLGLLDNGSKTRDFFCSGRRHGRRWRLKTHLEYGQVTRGNSKFNSLDDLKKIRPVCHLSDEDTMAQVEDVDNFIDLLKKMLYLDPRKRISPSLLLEDPFITMTDLIDSYPNSFYTKSACEMMEVCRDQSQRSEDMEQDSWLNPQASTSTATLDQHNTPSQVAPAWHNHQEHPLVLEVASAIFSSLSICDDQSPPRPQQLSCSVAKGKATPEHQLPTTSVATSDTGKVSDVRKLKRRFSETSQSGDRSLESGPAPKKKMRMDLIETHAEQHETSKEAPAEASSSMATATPQRKRTWATFVASYTGSRTPYTGSLERKKRKMTVMDSLSEAQTEAPSTEAKINPQRKRTWATFVASHPGLR